MNDSEAQLAQELARELGLPVSALIRMLLREKARAIGLKAPAV
jgi:hypothetical protein